MGSWEGQSASVVGAMSAILSELVIDETLLRTSDTAAGHAGNNGRGTAASGKKKSARRVRPPQAEGRVLPSSPLASLVCLPRFKDFFFRILPIMKIPRFIGPKNSLSACDGASSSCALSGPFPPFVHGPATSMTSMPSLHCRPAPFAGRWLIVYRSAMQEGGTP